jgi:hypothetical protein
MRPGQQIGAAMVNALVLFKMDDWVTDEMSEHIRSKSLANAKQLICGTLRDEIIADLAANTVKDLNVALGELSEVPGVRSVSVVRITQQS